MNIGYVARLWNECEKSPIQQEIKRCDPELLTLRIFGLRLILFAHQINVWLMELGHIYRALDCEKWRDALPRRNWPRQSWIAHYDGRVEALVKAYKDWSVELTDKERHATPGHERFSILLIRVEDHLYRLKKGCGLSDDLPTPDGGAVFPGNGAAGDARDTGSGPDATSLQGDAAPGTAGQHGGTQSATEMAGEGAPATMPVHRSGNAEQRATVREDGAPAGSLTRPAIPAVEQRKAVASIRASAMRFRLYTSPWLFSGDGPRPPFALAMQAAHWALKNAIAERRFLNTLAA